MRYYIVIFVATTIVGILVHDYRLHSLQQAARDAILRESDAEREGLQEYFSLGQQISDSQSRYLRCFIGIYRAATTRDDLESQELIRRFLDADAALRQAEQLKPRRAQLRRQFSIRDDPALTVELNRLERSVSNAREELKKLGSH